MKFLTTALVALFASNTVVGQTSGDYLAYGMGTTQCSEANQQFNKSQFEFTLSIWLTGYLTAINSVLSEQPVGLENSDLKDAVTAISEYCATSTNSSSSIAEAAEVYWRGRVKALALSGQ